MPLAGEHDRADVLDGRLLDRLAQAVDQFGVQRVAPFGTLHLQGQHVAVSGGFNHEAKPNDVSWVPADGR